MKWVFNKVSGGYELIIETGAARHSLVITLPEIKGKLNHISAEYGESKS
ncbi:hypothetical protein DFO73_11725 [Cytobacillus oceanisediminis]|uniref:Uncharacterized protein n=1 Tax=Cytobacillus oceanisediminis TaxID=665099 RepID=A0A2V2ZJ98_9BACI|nr:hypothetical protein [Cytobacillus oceanisediminis]PWW20025.1 hypothetical protein DFO73_11725 [Cytobacillus oceanisediminis]